MWLRVGARIDWVSFANQAQSVSAPKTKIGFLSGVEKWV